MMQYTLIGNEDGDQNIVVFIPGGSPMVAHSSHPYFDLIVQGARDGNPDVVNLFDLAQAADNKFREALSERVSVKDGKVFIDGDEADSAITRQIVRFIEAGIDSWVPLVAFIENVLGNPNEHSREQLYTWLSNRDFAITEDGMLLGYKGVKPDGNGGFESIHSGRAIVNGVEVTGNIPNQIGDVIEMPRSEVQFDPSVGCHTGLHVGTFEYAESFAQGALLLVEVNPRDVVSVPTDCDAQKMRTCRYQVVALAPQAARPLSAPLVYDHEADDDLWGDGEY